MRRAVRKQIEAAQTDAFDLLERHRKKVMALAERLVRDRYVSGPDLADLLVDLSSS